MVLRVTRIYLSRRTLRLPEVGYLEEGLTLHGRLSARGTGIWELIEEPCGSPVLVRTVFEK